MALDTQILVAYDEASYSHRERSGFLRAASVTLLTGAISSLIFQRLVIPEQTIRTVGPLFFMVVALAGRYLMGRGKEQAALYLMVIGSWVGLLLVIALTDGVRAPIVPALPVLILATGWLLGSSAALWMAGLTIAATIGLGQAEQHGMLILLADTPTALRVGMQVFVYVLAAALVFFAMRAVRIRENRLRQVHQELMQRTVDLDASQAELRAAQAVAKMGSLVYDFSTDTLHFSAETGRILGLPPDAQQARRPDLSSIHPDDQSRVQQVREAAERGQSFDIEYRVLVGDGVRHVQSKGEVTCGADGSPIKLLATVHDITERKHTEEALLEAKAKALAERANLAKSSFLATITHDLGQPISAVTLMVDVLQQVAPDTPRKLIDNMQACMKEMSDMLTDLMDVSKLEAGVSVPSLSDWSVQDILEAVIALHTGAAQKKGIQLYLRDTDAWTCTDRKLLHRIVGNLVSNAVRYTQDGYVMVACRRHAGKRWIEVWDTGIGIPADKLDGVFAEFTQVNHDERFGGFGLGLSIVVKASQLLGLQIRCRSNLGKGSMFAVELPPDRRQESDPPRERRSPATACRIGLVEDNLMLLESLALALQSSGFVVVGASSTNELLDRLGSQGPDVVISDFHLADGQTGADVVDSVRAVFGAQLPCLIITADSRVEHRQMMASRKVSVLQKPLNFDDILAFIHGATQRDSQTDPVERYSPAP